MFESFSSVAAINFLLDAIDSHEPDVFSTLKGNIRKYEVVTDINKLNSVKSPSPNGGNSQQRFINCFNNAIELLTWVINTGIKNVLGLKKEQAI